MSLKILAGSLAALALTAPAVALATVAPRAHPAYTDAAGDAKRSGLIRTNVPAADILASDVTTDGTTLTFTTRVAGARKALAGYDTFQVSAPTPEGGGSVLFSDNSSTAFIAFGATGCSSSGCSNNYGVEAPTTFDPATFTYTIRFDLARVNAARQANDDDKRAEARLPLRTLTPLSESTVVTQARTDSSASASTTSTQTIATDVALSSGPFTLGG